MGPCTICGNDDLREKFHKLIPNLLLKAMQSPATPNLKVKLSLNDQLCQKHYTELVVFDRNLSPNNQCSSADNISLEHSEKIMVEQLEIGNGVYRSIKSVLDILLPIWKHSSPPILISEDTNRLKLGDNGYNVGHKQNYVMITFCLLNEGSQVLKPDYQYW
ncbi:25064_t:CDS:2 [Cetraspora pellucida]|uniref:25064_t:CDS:1 n=1 Tax=Cetraspora pellucida TaxID=1433469 RepID=A0A9N9HIP4_9GLOM|nr:25064_t:CDS:2 [Cetraspora pellucida]